MIAPERRDMPRHWRPIAPDNPDPKKRVEEVRGIVESDEHKGKLLFCGRERDENKWWALVNVKDVRDPEKMWREVRSLGPGKILLGEDEV
jgi:hypothetical protein